MCAKERGRGGKEYAEVPQAEKGIAKDLVPWRGNVDGYNQYLRDPSGSVTCLGSTGVGREVQEDGWGE